MTSILSDIYKINIKYVQNEFPCFHDPKLTSNITFIPLFSAWEQTKAQFGLRNASNDVHNLFICKVPASSSLQSSILHCGELSQPRVEHYVMWIQYSSPSPNLPSLLLPPRSRYRDNFVCLKHAPYFLKLAASACQNSRR